MSTENQLRKQLQRKIEELPTEKLRELSDYIGFLDNAVSEPPETYVAKELEDNLEETFKNTDYSNREYKPNENTRTINEVFDGITDMMSAHYGMDMRKLSKRHS